MKLRVYTNLNRFSGAAMWALDRKATVDRPIHMNVKLVRHALPKPPDFCVRKVFVLY